MERGHPTGFVLTSSQLEPRRDGVANQRGGLKWMYCKQRVRRVVVCQNLYLRLVLLLANCQLNRGDTRGLPKEAAMVPLSLGIALLEQAGVMRMMPFSFGRIKCVIFLVWNMTIGFVMACIQKSKKMLSSAESLVTFLVTFCCCFAV